MLLYYGFSGTKCNYGLYHQGTYLGHSINYSSMVWPGTNYNIITWSSTKCDTMFWGQLLFVMLSFRYSTKCSNILAQHRFNNIAVMTINTNTSAKCNIIVHDNTCCTKCNNNDWSYPSNGAKCSTIVVILLLLWSYHVNSTKCISR